MPSWMNRASTLLKGHKSEPEVPDPFRVVCLCGNSIGGMRQRRTQISVCVRCGERLLILPKDPYPGPPPPPQAISVSADQTISPEGKPVVKPVKPAALPENLSPAERAARRFEEAQKQKKKVEEEAKAAAEPKLEPAKARGSIVTPFRTIVIGIACVLVGTVYWGIKARRADLAARVVRTAINEADEAVSNGDLSTAARKYAEASEALTVLKRNDPEALRVHQANRETSTAGRLLLGSLHEIGDEARKAQEGASEGWQDSLRTRYQGQWLIIQAPVKSSTDADANPRTQIVFPIAAGATSVIVETDESALETLVGGEADSDAIFAAQIDEVRYESEPGREQWILTLRADTLFPWSNWKTFELVGLAGAGEDEDADARKILDRQSERLGVPK
ncbi:MAG: hypothetical protein AB7O26_07010 [Planctomycetaceae bacterium]